MRAQLWRHVASTLLLCALAIPTVARADVTLPSIFSDHMVLQREKPIPVWGEDAPGTAVTVRFGESEAKATADDDGAWRVELPARDAGGPFELTVTGSSTVTFEDVLVGEVWLCSGQSNMEWPVRASDGHELEATLGYRPRIRHIKVQHVPAAEPQADIRTSGWQPASPETVPHFTAVGYFFARHLIAELDVPIGLIGSNWGGTRIEPWTPPSGFRAVPALSDIAGSLDEYPQKRDDGNINHQSALALYNGMIHPIVPYALRGALWYQGESNNGEGMLYHEKMKALIAGWRDVWSEPELPFYFVQLAPYRYGGDPTRLAAIWQAQLETLSVPHTGMAVTVDIGNTRDIHPRNKKDVGRRLALWALAKTYGREGLVHSGPLYRSMEVEGSTIRVSFDHAGSGLVSRDGWPLSHFEIAGADGEFVAAQAKIDGDSVVVRADSVAEPKSVRYGWHQEAEPNLSNAEGLPASPFHAGGE